MERLWASLAIQPRLEELCFEVERRKSHIRTLSKSFLAINGVNRANFEALKQDALRDDLTSPQESLLCAIREMYEKALVVDDVVSLEKIFQDAREKFEVIMAADEKEESIRAKRRQIDKAILTCITSTRTSMLEYTSRVDELKTRLEAKRGQLCSLIRNLKVDAQRQMDEALRESYQTKRHEKLRNILERVESEHERWRSSKEAALMDAFEERLGRQKRVRSIGEYVDSLNARLASEPLRAREQLQQASEVLERVSSLERSLRESLKELICLAQKQASSKKERIKQLQRERASLVVHHSKALAKLAKLTARKH